MLATLSFDTSDITTAVEDLLRSNSLIAQRLDSETFQHLLNLPNVILFADGGTAIGADGFNEILVKVKLNGELEDLLTTITTR